MPLCILNLCTYVYLPIADTVSFNQSVYTADEEDGSIQIVLVLTSALPYDIVVQVISSNINTTGRYKLSCYTYIVTSVINTQKMILSLDLIMLQYRLETLWDY